MAPSHVPHEQPDVSNSTSIFATTIKHIAAENPTQPVEATASRAFRSYFTTPLSWIASSAFVITGVVLFVSIVLLDKIVSAACRALRRRVEDQVRYMQIRREELQRECEEQLEREEAQWQIKKDEIIRDRPNDVESLEYISGQPEEF